MLENMTNMNDASVSIQSVDMSHVTDMASFEEAMGEPLYTVDGPHRYKRISWVFGRIAYWLISQYGTVYDPSRDRDTATPAVMSYKDHANPELFIGDKHLHPDVPRPARIQGMVAEDINRVYIFLVQVRKVMGTSTTKSISSKPQGAALCFQPIFTYPDEVDEEPEELGPIAQATDVERKNIDMLRLLGQFTQDRSGQPDWNRSGLDMYIEMANKDATGAIRLKGGGSGGMMEVKAP